MKLRFLPVVLTILFAALAAQPRASAQIGLYLNPIAMRISNSVADHGTFAFLGQNSTSAIFYGEEFGAYYDFKTPYAFKAGIDLRDSNLHGNSASLNNFLFGLRISGQPFHNGFKPYIEPAAGFGSSKAPYTAIRVSKGEYGIYAGLDYATHHHIDFRLLEIGYSQLTTASSETIGGTAVIPTSSIVSFSTGLVFRFP